MPDDPVKKDLKQFKKLYAWLGATEKSNGKMKVYREVQKLKKTFVTKKEKIPEESFKPENMKSFREWERFETFLNLCEVDQRKDVQVIDCPIYWIDEKMALGYFNIMLVVYVRLNRPKPKKMVVKVQLSEWFEAKQKKIIG